MADDAPLAETAGWRRAVRRYQRGAIDRFVRRHHLAWEGAFAALAFVYLIVGLLTDESRGPSPYIIGAIAGIFVAEFVARLYDAVSRRRYLREHWLDLASALPLVGGLRSVRIFRLVRLLPAVRVLRSVAHEVDGRSRERHSLWYLGPVLFIAWVSSSAAYWTFEHDINPHVTSFADALYWSLITTTTVGYGDVTPITSEGRILAGLVIFVGIGLVGFASARITGHLLRHHDGGADALHDRLGRLESQLTEVTELLRSLSPQADMSGRPRATIDPCGPGGAGGDNAVTENDNQDDDDQEIRVGAVLVGGD